MEGARVFVRGCFEFSGKAGDFAGQKLKVIGTLSGRLIPATAIEAGSPM